MKVTDVMTTDVVTIAPSASLRDAASLLVEHGVSGLPVVEDGRLVGVISEADLIVKEGRPRERSRLHRRTSDDQKITARLVGEAMTSPVVTVNAWASVSTAAALMLEAGIGRLPVLRGAELVGIVTRADLVRALLRTDAELEYEIRHDIIRGSFWVTDEDVRVAVHDGNVALTALSPDFEVALLERAVERVPGVVSVTLES
jgi:CBS domain-containing protein